MDELNSVTMIAKIYALQDQLLNLSEVIKTDIENFLVFAIRIYVIHWFQCENPFLAARTDLSILRKLKNFQHVDKQISDQVVSCFTEQLWYLSPSVIALCLFDPEVTQQDKEEIRIKMLSAGKTKNSLCFFQLSVLPNVLVFFFYLQNALIWYISMDETRCRSSCLIE